MSIRPRLVMSELTEMPRRADNRTSISSLGRVFPSNHECTAVLLMRVDSAKAIALPDVELRMHILRFFPNLAAESLPPSPEHARRSPAAVAPYNSKSASSEGGVFCGMSAGLPSHSPHAEQWPGRE